MDKSYNWKSWIIKKLISNDSTKDEILNFLTSNEDNTYTDLKDNDQKNLIKNILKLGESSVEDIMVPRSEIISVEQNNSYEDILKIIKVEGHSRMPVYNKILDDTVGFFHIKDFINLTENNFNLNSIIRDILYVAPKSPILNLLETMRSSRIHIGLVVDGFGGVDGLITIEDLVEEIVGEIEDEHDAEDIENLIIKKGRNIIEVDASFRIDDLEKYFSIKLDIHDEEIETVGGLVFSKINKIPKNNEIIEIDNFFKIKIIKSNERKILKVEIRKLSN